MSEALFVGIICVVVWASLPISIIIANDVFDKDVVKEGEDPHHH